MTKNRILYIVAVIAGVVFSMAYTSKISAVVLITVLSYPVLALIFVIVQLFTVKADFSGKRIIVQKNEPFELSVNIKNNSILPCAPIEFRCLIPDCEIGLFSERRVFVSLSSFGQTGISINCMHKYRGCYLCQINAMSAVDPLRIIRLTKKLRLGITAVVVPRTIELKNIIFSDDGEQNPLQNRPDSFEKEDFSHVRDYRDGDIMQLVHWKLTAKQDELMIKQFDSINDNRMIVLCDFNIYPGECNVLLRTDTVIETAIAFVKASLDKGVHAFVDYGDMTSENRITINDAGSYNKFFEIMSVLPAKLNVCDFISLIDGTDIDSGSVLVLITTELTDEIIARANSAARRLTVFYAYINLSARPLERDFSEERFFFLNICDSGERALNNAAKHINESSGF